MKWSVKRTNDCNGMKLYCGCISPTERRKRACEDEERTAEKIRLSRLWLDCLIFLCCAVSVERRKEAFSADNQLEQPNGTKGTTAERPLDCPLFLNKQIKLIVRICYGTEIAKGCSKKQPFAFKKLTKTKKIYKPINIAQSI